MRKNTPWISSTVPSSLRGEKEATPQKQIKTQEQKYCVYKQVLFEPVSTRTKEEPPHKIKRPHIKANSTKNGHEGCANEKPC